MFFFIKKIKEYSLVQNSCYCFVTASADTYKKVSLQLFKTKNISISCITKTIILKTSLKLVKYELAVNLDNEMERGADIVLHPSGKWLYLCHRGAKKSMNFMAYSFKKPFFV